MAKFSWDLEVIPDQIYFAWRNSVWIWKPLESTRGSSGHYPGSECQLMRRFFFCQQLSFSKASDEHANNIRIAYITGFPTGFPRTAHKLPDKRYRRESRLCCEFDLQRPGRLSPPNAKFLSLYVAWSSYCGIPLRLVDDFKIGKWSYAYSIS